MASIEEDLLSMCKQSRPRIGIDLLGSDADSNTVLESALPVLLHLQNQVDFVLFGESKNESILRSIKNSSYQIAQEVIHMEDDPLLAIRKKTTSSLVIALQSLKRKEIDALISLGNTGALTAGAAIHLKRLPHISRPALLALVPSQTHNIALLDVGANTICQPSHFLEFAAMGIAYQKTRGIAKPTIGLLNIGKEPTKGTPTLQEAYQQLLQLNEKYDYPLFLGNVEGREVFKGTVDILLTDGFTGNIFLKTSEGMLLFLLEQINKPFPSLQEKLETAEHAGALLVGVQGLVLKCHGRADPKIFSHCINHALSLIKEKNSFEVAIESEIATFFPSI